jgi:2-methylisocitrate lyase-like PEP mutase family enzyme
MPGFALYEEFMALHSREGGLVLPNAWDGLSALLLADAGFEAVATSSAALAATLGRPDGKHEVTRGEHLEHARLLGWLTEPAVPTTSSRAGRISTTRSGA